VSNKKAFQTLLDTFKQQLEQQTLSPTWWSTIATQVTHEDGQLTLEQFTNSYQEAIDSFTIEDYQTALKHLLKPSSYQRFRFTNEKHTPNHASSQTKTKASKLRIIAGEWRSRQLPIPDVQGLRPTPDKVRETLFNWINYSIPGAVCGDFFVALAH